VRVVGSVPEPISSAIRAGKPAKATAAGLSFEVAPVEVEPGACESVPVGQLAVLPAQLPSGTAARTSRTMRSRLASVKGLTSSGAPAGSRPRRPIGSPAYPDM